MSKRMDTSSTTLKADILDKQRRSSGTSWTKFIWSSISPIVTEKTIRGSFVEHGWWKSAQIGNVCLFFGNEGYLCQYLWTSSEWLERSRTWLPCERNWWKNVDIDEPTSFLDQVYFGMYSAWMQTEWNNYWTIIEMFESRVSAGATEKLPGWEKPHAQTVSWSYDIEGHTQKCVERYCELANKKDRAVKQSLKSVLGWSPMQAGRARICWRIVRSLLTNCPKNLCTWHELEDQTLCGLSTNLQDQSLNGHRHATDDQQDWFHTSSHKRIPTTLSRGQHGQSL